MKYTLSCGDAMPGCSARFEEDSRIASFASHFGIKTSLRPIASALALPGMVGGFLGAVVLTSISLEAAKMRSPPLADAFARYADCLLAQILQSVACNSAHPIEHRVLQGAMTPGDLVLFTTYLSRVSETWAAGPRAG